MKKSKTMASKKRGDALKTTSRRVGPRQNELLIEAAIDLTCNEESKVTDNNSMASYNMQASSI